MSDSYSPAVQPPCEMCASSSSESPSNISFCPGGRSCFLDMCSQWKHEEERELRHRELKGQEKAERELIY